MKLKLDETGHVVVADGKPVYVHEDGKEIPFDAPGTVATITRLNGEAKGHREAKERAETALKAFEGIEDPAAALKAIETLKNIDQGQLVAAGKVDEIKAAANKAAEERIAAAQKELTGKLTESEQRNAALTSQLYDEKIGGAFSRSQFIADKIAVPADMLQAVFGKGFKVEDGAIVAYGGDGNKIFSRAKPGEIAGFDEALELMVEQYPFRDNILKGSGASGGGAGGGGGGSGGGAKQVTRAAFEAMNPAKRMEFSKAGGKIVD